MKNKLQIIICAAVAISGAVLIGGCESERGEGKESKAALESEAKITKTDAERMALARVPGGTIKEGELEKEKGHLIWSFDIATPGTSDITEVNIDAISGKVIAVDKESAEQEKKEAAKEKKSEKEDDEKEEKK